MKIGSQMAPLNHFHFHNICTCKVLSKTLLMFEKYEDTTSICHLQHVKNSHSTIVSFNAFFLISFRNIIIILLFALNPRPEMSNM